MVGIPGGSRGCETCRQRKIKCDLAVPSCSQCRRSKRPCPGPRTGPVFVNMTVPLEEYEKNKTPYLTALSRLPPACPQLRRPAFEQLFVSHYMQSFGDQQESIHSPFWLNRLPALLCSAHTPLPTIQCIRAVGLLFYGNLSHNTTVQTEAFKWYGGALKSLSVQMRKRANKDTQSALISAERLICAPVMLFHFEVMTGAPMNAWLLHLSAATTMLKKLGPDQCSIGFVRQLFLNVRLFTAVLKLFEPGYGLQAFTLDEWLTVPFQIIPKNPVDHLVDLVLSFPDSEISATPEQPGASPTRSPAAHQLHTYVSKLEDWWLDNMGELPDRDEQKPCEERSLVKIPKEAVSGQHWLKRAITQDVVLVSFMALYHSACITTLSMLAHLEPAASGRLLYRNRIEFHCNEVLTASEVIKERHGCIPGSGSMFLYTFSLKIVSKWTPSSQQKERADRQFESWVNTLITHAYT